MGRHRRPNSMHRSLVACGLRDMERDLQMSDKDDERAEQQAMAQLASIREMVADLEAAEESEDEDKIEEAKQTIYEDPLNIQVRSAWVDPGTEKFVADEFNILLCTGGPAVRIVGELDEHCCVYGVPKLEAQDWFTPWVEVNFWHQYFKKNGGDPSKNEEARAAEKALVRYCSEFWWGA